MNSNFWSAVFLLTGTTIGAGIFAIPYVTAQVGYLNGLLWLLILSVVTIIINLIYAQVIIDTHSLGTKAKQFVGFADQLLGAKGKWVSLAVSLVGHWGAVLVYLIGIGEFLSILLNQPENKLLFTLVAFFVVAAAIWFKTQIVALLEGWLTFGKVVIILLITIAGSQLISSSNLTSIPELSFVKYFLPFGVMMNALSGYAVLPEMAQVSKNAVSFRKSVIIGTLIPIAVYLIFQFVVVGVSGEYTSPEAIIGLVPYFDIGIIKLGALFGVMAMLSAYLTLSLVLKDTFREDFKMSNIKSWYWSVLPPLLMYLSGLNDFISVLNFTGTWLGLTTIFLILVMFLVAKRKVRKK